METKMVSYITNFYKNITIGLLVIGLGCILFYGLYVNGYYQESGILLFLFLMYSLYLALNIHLWLNIKIGITTSDDGFLFELEKKSGLERITYPFSEIEAYQIRFTGNDNCPAIKIYTKYDSPKEYIFITRKDEEDQFDSKLLVKTLHLRMQKYNIGKAEDQKIEFRPSFAATKAGLYVLIFWGVAYIVFVITMIILTAKGYSMHRSFIAYFAGLFPFFAFLIARRSGITFRDEMMKDVEKELK